MKRWFTVLGASVALALGAGVGTAAAGEKESSGQTIDQTQTVTNSVR
jgi:hypothetical protein